MSKENKFNWDDYETVGVVEKPKQESDFNWDDYDDADNSKLESLARGYGQGATFGFAEEASAGLFKAIAAFDDVIGGRIAGLIQNGPKGLIAGTPEEQQDTISDQDYSSVRDEMREDNREAREANPKSYGAGEFLGGAITSTALGAGSGSLARNVAQATAEGAAYGAGVSESDNIKDLVKDSAIGATIGGLSSYTLGKAGQKLQQTRNELRQGAKSALKSTAKNAPRIAKEKLDDKLNTQVNQFADKFGFGEERVFDRLKKNPTRIKQLVDNPQEIDFAYTSDTIGEFLEEAEQKLGKNVAEFRNIARESANTQITVPKKAQQSLQQVVRKLRYTDGSPRPGLGGGFKEILNTVGEKVNSKRLNLPDALDLVDDIDGFNQRAIKQENRLAQDLGFELREIRRELKNSMREILPEWSEADAAYSQFKDLVTQNGNLINKLKKDTGTGLVKNLFNKPKEKTRKSLFQALDFIDPDISQAFYDDILDQVTANNINNVRLGKADAINDKQWRNLLLNEKKRDMITRSIGGAVGLAFGGADGGLFTGLAADTLGDIVANQAAKKAPTASKMLGEIAETATTKIVPPQADRLTKILAKDPGKLGKYAKPLAAAAERGGRALAVSNYVLQKKDPEYQKIIKQIENEDDE